MNVLVRLLTALTVLVTASLFLAAPADAIPGFDCKESPVPEVPDRGLAGFFAGAPDRLPPEADPFADNARTTIFEQYGYAGLRWSTYDLGCGPDAMRQPDAVIGTAISNWLMQLPLALTALTGSVTEVAFNPELLSGLDDAVSSVSAALHDNFFASWIPLVLALLGALVIFRARSASMATSAAAVGWALIVILVATALFRWPVEAGRAADATVTQTLGAVVSKLDGNGASTDPGTAVASNVSESILYRAWLAGTFGSPDSKAAQKYGPDLFRAHAYSWHELAEIEDDPAAGKRIFEDKQADWKRIAEQIQEEDPEAYQHLTGLRSETRVGYAILGTLGVFLALPFLLMSSLLLIGCFLIVRLAVMLFPAFATLGAFPAARGLVTGLGRLVGAAVVNATIFGIGAGVTIALLGVLFSPGGDAPSWLGLVLMPLFSAVMWVALRPFRRLTSMVSPNGHQLLGRVDSPRWIKRAAAAGLGALTGGAAAGVVAASLTDEDDKDQAPDRAEARPTVTAPWSQKEQPYALPAGADKSSPQEPSSGPRPTGSPGRPRHRAEPTDAPALEPGFIPRPREDSLSPAVKSEFDGDEVFVIYRPDDDAAVV